VSFVLAQAVNGVVFGMLLFLLAAGLTLMLGTMQIVNLAHGSFYLLGGYIGYSVVQWTGSFVLGCLAGLVAIGVLGAASYRFILSKESMREVLPQVLVTFGMLLIVSDLCRWIWGGVPLAIPKPEWLKGAVLLSGTILPIYRLAVIAIGLAVALFLWWFLEKTKYGAIVRAGVDDAQMAQGIGIDIAAVKLFVFSLGAMLAGFAGSVGGPLIGLHTGLDLEILLLALVVVIIGGMGSLRGALIGALLIGLLDAFGKSLVPELSMFLIFTAMLVVLAIRPAGLFGSHS
jgi:branched-chain amino acid transport system permease protein